MKRVRSRGLPKVLMCLPFIYVSNLFVEKKKRMFPEHGASYVDAFQASTQFSQQDCHLDEAKQVFPTQHIDIDDFITTQPPLSHSTYEGLIQRNGSTNLLAQHQRQGNYSHWRR
jgi:hypothetical protein